MHEVERTLDFIEGKLLAWCDHLKQSGQNQWDDKGGVPQEHGEEKRHRAFTETKRIGRRRGED